MTMTPRRWGWLAMLVLLVGLVGYGVADASASDASAGARAQKLAESVMCPTCRGQSVADSDSSAAKGIRNYIDDAISEGDSDAEIRDYLASRYGEGILLTPSRSGLSSLVWMLPVVAFVLAAVGIGLAFRSWRQQQVTTRASKADEQLVERALDEGGATT